MASTNEAGDSGGTLRTVASGYDFDAALISPSARNIGVG
jgi:hypothetical protein